MTLKLILVWLRKEIGGCRLFLINMPVVSYFEAGTILTPNHGQAVLPGAYGMLAIALVTWGLELKARGYTAAGSLWSDSRPPSFLTTPLMAAVPSPRLCTMVVKKGSHTLLRVGSSFLCRCLQLTGRPKCLPVSVIGHYFTLTTGQGAFRITN